MSNWRFHRPPGALKSATLDNLVLVPASLLSKKANYQELANRLPRGQILVILPSCEAPRRVLENAAAQMRNVGHQVSTVAAETFA